MGSLPPGTLILLGAFAVPLLHPSLRRAWVLAIPVVSFVQLFWVYPVGHVVESEFFGQSLMPIRVDKLSLVWGYVFHVAAILAAVYSIRVCNRVEHFVAMVYVGASIGAIFAGDLLTLFVYWELTALSSMFLIWAGGSPGSFAAGMRYALMHVGSGVLVLAGALLLYVERGTLSFGRPDELGLFQELSSWGPLTLLIGFGVKAAFPLLHCWLPDAYPRATAAGTVFLSAFTTKMAIYALVRAFAGCEVLIPIGTIMVLFPLVHAILADDMRRSLAHALHNQLGFMVVGIGIGSELAINGVAAQAFAHVIYKGLLFMAVGAVLHRTGTARQSALGGLAKQMPWTCVFCLVAGLSVAPLNCGFVTKSLVLSAVAEEHLVTVWLLLSAGAAVAFLVVGLRIPYFLFFGKPILGAEQIEEAPREMLVAMGCSASICLLIGAAPSLLYRALPYALEYHPYSFSHVTQQLQVLAFAALGFFLANRAGLYPLPTRGTLLDVDWFYRVLPKALWRRLQNWQWNFDHWRVSTWLPRGERWLAHQCGETGALGKSVSTNTMAISAVILLAVYLLIYY